MKKLKFLMTPILALGLLLGVSVSDGHAELSTVTVEKGDTLWSIAKSHDVTIFDIYEWNLGIDPYNLQVGSEVVVEPASDWYHTVSRGDTFYRIATIYEHISLTDLYAWNPNVDPFNLQIGSQIRIQDFDYGEEYYTIQPGDTLFWIAMIHADVSLLDLYNLNPGIDPYNLQIGSKIRVK